MHNAHHHGRCTSVTTNSGFRRNGFWDLRNGKRSKTTKREGKYPVQNSGTTITGPHSWRRPGASAQPCSPSFCAFHMKRSTFWSGFNVSVIQSHRHEGVKISMKHQTTASLKLYVDLASLIIPASHLGQYNPPKSNILEIKLDINTCCKQRHCGGVTEGGAQSNGRDRFM